MTNNKTDKNKSGLDKVPEPKKEGSLDSAAEKKVVTSSVSSSTLKNTEKTSKDMSKTVRKPEPKIKMPKTNIPQDKMSKMALFATALSFTAIGLVASLFYFDKQERSLLSEQITTKNEQNNNDIQQKITQLLANQQAALLQQFKSEITAVKKANQLELTHLSNTVDKLKQNQPSDWLIHEAEYLIRIAGRTLWLERDTIAAIALLQDADQRLKSLNDPNYLLVRQAVNDDVAALKLVPALNTEETILTLMAMSKKVAVLKLKMVDIPDSVELSENLALTNNAADWRENLAKTWQKFLKDFITVNRRKTNVEPLISANAQQHLRENLRLKLQVAQWAASKEQQQLYSQTLSDIERWLIEYFAIESSINQSFIKSIGDLKTAKIIFDHNHRLSSLGVIRTMMTTQQTLPVAEIKKVEDKNKTADESEQINNLDKSLVEKSAEEKTETTPKALNDIHNNNGEI